MNTIRKYWIHLVHPAALTPLALLLWDFSQNNLTVNPIQEITHRTGTYALVLLILSLVCTPLNTMFGWKRVVTLRRPLGLYGFLYASLHMLVFVGLDYGFNWDLIVSAIVEKRYVLAGLAALLLLTPLAITSTRGWMKRLGKRWKVLHKLVYLAIPLVVIHYLWLVKSDLRTPLTYGAVVALLLVLRLPAIRRAAGTLRNRLTKRVPQPVRTRAEVSGE